MGFEKKNHRLEALRNSSIEKFGKGGFFIVSEGIHNKVAGNFGNERHGSYFDQYLPCDTEFRLNGTWHSFFFMALSDLMLFQMVDL